MICSIFRIEDCEYDEDLMLQLDGELSPKRRRIGGGDNLLEDNLSTFSGSMSAAGTGEDSQMEEFVSLRFPSEKDEEDRHYPVDGGQKQVREQPGNFSIPSDIVPDRINHILPGLSETVKMTRSNFQGLVTPKDSVVLCDVKYVRFSAVGTSEAPSKSSMEETGVGEGEGEGKKEELFSLRTLKEWALQRMAPYKIPTILKVVKAIPRNAMGKVNKKDLLRHFFSEEYEIDKKMV